MINNSMWIIDFIPNFYYYLTMAGVLVLLAAWCLSFLPIIKQYSLPLNVVGSVLTMIGIYWMGGVAVEREWQARVKEVEAKLAVAEAKSAKVNTKIVTKVLEKRVVVKERAQERTKYIDREIVKYNNKCEIPPEALKVLNSAVNNKPIDALEERGDKK